MSDWHLLKIKVEDKNMEFYIDNVKVYSDSFTRPTGGILGIDFRIKGSGKVDFVTLKNLEEKIIFSDNFDSD